ncbi:MAG: hypothetical protein ACFFDW_04130 [Candidatus Thorarchaeota archaeon]
MLDEFIGEIEKKVLEKLDSIKRDYTGTEKEILDKLTYLQEGYVKRDTNQIENWVKTLMDESVQIIGTNSIYPLDFEWRSGHQAAIEMFKNDWLRWGKVRYFVDFADINVDGNLACVTMFAVVTRDTRAEENRTFDASKKRSLQRIKEITEKNIPSTLALYEIIYDASMILSQYEKSPIMVWPIRTSFVFMKKNNTWLIKQLHYSWPGQGFPAVRLFLD